MSNPEDMDKIHTDLSDTYEKSLRSIHFMRRVGNAAIIGMPSIGALNFFYADQPLLSSYVSGSVLAGLLVKGATAALNISADKKIMTPILDLQRERFENEFYPDES